MYLHTCNAHKKHTQVIVAHCNESVISIKNVLDKLSFPKYIKRGFVLQTIKKEFKQNISN